MNWARLFESSILSIRLTFSIAGCLHLKAYGIALGTEDVYTIGRDPKPSECIVTCSLSLKLHACELVIFEIAKEARGLWKYNNIVAIGRPPWLVGKVHQYQSVKFAHSKFGLILKRQSPILHWSPLYSDTQSVSSQRLFYGERAHEVGEISLGRTPVSPDSSRSRRQVST